MPPNNFVTEFAMSDKLPALQFYPGDWRKDSAVQSLSYHDRGVWFEMLMLMHGSEVRGKLILNGKPIPEDALCRLLGLDKQTLNQTITTLLDFGVASKCPETGALMNRRMIRDEKIRKVRSEAGKMGGNPDLLKQKRTTRVKQNSTPSSSSSIHTLSESELLEVYEAYPRHTARPAALKAIRKATERVAKKDATSQHEALVKLKSRVESYARLERKKSTESQFIPHPSTWFNGERYDDEELLAEPGELQRSTSVYRDPAALYDSPEYSAERKLA
jgi:hypothetical protein